jgi:hypothetical protein
MFQQHTYDARIMRRPESMYHEGSTEAGYRIDYSLLAYPQQLFWRCLLNVCGSEQHLFLCNGWFL